MYERVKSLLLRLLKVPPEPHDPMGDVQSLRVFRAAPGYLHYITLGWAISQLAVMTGGLIVVTSLLFASASAGAARRPIALLLLIVACLILVAFLCQAGLTYFSLRLNYEMRWYKVTDRSLRIRAGVWNVHEMTMTFANVQNISITQGPLERLFGISDVRVETAGGGKANQTAHGGGGGGNLHTAVFRGVDDPEEIRDLMMTRLRRIRGAGLGDPEDGQHLDASSVSTSFGRSTATMTLLAAFRDEARALRRVMDAADTEA